MSSVTTTNTPQLPAHIRARAKDGGSLLDALGSGLFSGGYPRISIKGSRFRIVDGKNEQVLDVRSLRTVVVGANPNTSKIFYKGKWDPKQESQGPDCSSMDGVRPLPGSRDPQAQLCATCPQNQWGSRTSETGGKIKACSDHKRLAVVAADDPGGPIYLLQITPAALRGLAEYHRMLSHKGFPLECVVTEISFDPNESFPKMTFSFGGFVDEQTLGIVDSIIGSYTVQEITGEVVPATNVASSHTTDDGSSPVLVAKQVQEPEPEPIDHAETKQVRGFGAAKQPTVDDIVTPSKPKTSAKETVAVSTVAADSLTDDIRALLGEDDD